MPGSSCGEDVREIPEPDRLERLFGSAFRGAGLLPSLGRREKSAADASVPGAAMRADECVLEHGQLGEDGGRLQRPDDVIPAAADDRHRAGIGLDPPRQDAKRGGLARAVRADQGMDGRGRDVDVHVVESHHRAEALRQPSRLDGDRRGNLPRPAPGGHRGNGPGTPALTPPVGERGEEAPLDRADGGDDDQRDEQRLQSGRLLALQPSELDQTAEQREHRNAEEPARGSDGSAEHDGDEELRREQRPVRCGIGHQGEMDTEAAGRRRKRGTEREGRGTQSGHRDPESFRGRSVLAGGRERDAHGASPEHPEEQNGERRQADAELVVNRRRELDPRDAALLDRDALRAAGDRGERCEPDRDEPGQEPGEHRHERRTQTARHGPDHTACECGQDDSRQHGALGGPAGLRLQHRRRESAESDECALAE